MGTTLVKGFLPRAKSLREDATFVRAALRAEYEPLGSEDFSGGER